MLPLLVAFGLAHASDVLVPTFTPATLSDFGPAESLTEETLAALNSRGVVFVPPSEIQLRAGSVAEGCAEAEECIDVLWDKFPPSRLAIIGRVTWNEGMLETSVRFYGPDDASPIEVMSSTIPEAEIPRFADQVAFFAEELLSLVPPRDDAVVPIAAEPRQRVAEAPAQPESRYAPEETGERRDEQGAGPTRQSAGMIPEKVWRRYEDSGLTWRRFKERELIRAGSVTLELHGSALFGDIDRAYDVRVGVIQDDESTAADEATFSEFGLYQAEGFVSGTGWSVGATVGYLPLWWLEIGVSGGMQVGRKYLTTGWEQYLPSDEQNPYDTSSQDFDPTLAFMGMVEPRLRWYFVATGPVKPYVVTGATLRFYDGYVVPDLDTIKYPDRTGGMSTGLTAGAGLAFDAPGGFIASLEVPWTYLLTPDTFVRTSDTLARQPGVRKSSGQLLGLRAGIGFRL